VSYTIKELSGFKVNSFGMKLNECHMAERSRMEPSVLRIIFTVIQNIGMLCLLQLLLVQVWSYLNRQWDVLAGNQRQSLVFQGIRISVGIREVFGGVKTLRLYEYLVVRRYSA